jgi:hypothetical protein
MIPGGYLPCIMVNIFKSKGLMPFRPGHSWINGPKTFNLKGPFKPPNEERVNTWMSGQTNLVHFSMYFYFLWRWGVNGIKISILTLSADSSCMERTWKSFQLISHLEEWFTRCYYAHSEFSFWEFHGMFPILTVAGLNLSDGVEHITWGGVSSFKVLSSSWLLSKPSNSGFEK